MRTRIIQQYQPGVADTILQTLEAGQIEEDFSCHITRKKLDAILHNIRKTHKHDKESTPETSTTKKMIADVRKYMMRPGDFVEKFCQIMCSQLGIIYAKLTSVEQTALKNHEKSSALKNSPLNSRKR